MRNDLWQPLEILRDALILTAQNKGIPLCYNPAPVDWKWNKYAVNAALGLIDHIRLTGKLPSEEVEYE